MAMEIYVFLGELKKVKLTLETDYTQTSSVIGEIKSVFVFGESSAPYMLPGKYPQENERQGTNSIHSI